jgi:thiamine biosynthesis protein ThiS
VRPPGGIGNPGGRPYRVRKLSHAAGSSYTWFAMRVTANGKLYEVGDDTTIEGFIRLRGLDPQLVVVELNGDALERSRYGTPLADGDRMELVRAVAGG